MNKNVPPYRVVPFATKENGKMVKRYKMVARNGKKVGTYNTESWALRAVRAHTADDKSNKSCLRFG